MFRCDVMSASGSVQQLASGDESEALAGGNGVSLPDINNKVAASLWGSTGWRPGSNGGRCAKSLTIIVTRATTLRT